MGNVWRKAATPITLVLLLAILGFGMWWGWRELTRIPEAPAPEPCVKREATELSTEQVSVQVLNGGSIAGRAGQISQHLETLGFQVLPAANTNERIEQTVIVGGQTSDPAVTLVAGFFPESITRGDGHVDGTIQVLVGDNFAGFNDEAPRTIEVPGGEICVPKPSSQPSASVSP